MTNKIIQIKHLTEGGDVFVDMSDDEANPCKHCGACCTHYRVSFYQGELQSNGGVVPTEMVSPINSFMVAMKGSEQGGRCGALKGEIGENSTCSIYHNRPSVCRTFYVWDDEGKPNPRCQELRKKIGLNPLKELV